MEMSESKYSLVLQVPKPTHHRYSKVHSITAW